MSHKFKVGQHVRQSTVGYADAKSVAGGLFEVVRLMPEDRTGEPSYRVKSAVGERAVREGELTLAS
ncbi:hypothetical protein [Methylobacterium soli]|uniref:DUF2945 domain-containing protein n=1 Tax=Methylobacterium soli TaxID=553447 RepID=A0A6L3SNN5_9HYPH|nr:hypothetical protein [Methylobacterium soli]KAB1069547.1 hypothetical protein F6X53_30885 [Methylobacterium soli]